MTIVPIMFLKLKYDYTSTKIKFRSSSASFGNVEKSEVIKFLGFVQPKFVQSRFRVFFFFLEAAFTSNILIARASLPILFKHEIN